MHKFLKPKCWKIDRLNHVTAKSRETRWWFQICFLSFFYLYLHLGEMIQLDLHNIFQLGWNSTQAPFLGNHQATGYHGCCWWFQVAQPGYWDALYVGVLIGSLGEVFGGSEPCTWKTWLVLGVKLRVKLTATCLKEAVDICSCSRKRSHIPPLRMFAKSSFFRYVPALDGGGICDRSLEGM